MADTPPAAAARVAPQGNPKSVPSSFKPSVAFLGDANFDQITARVEAPAAVSITGNFLSSEPEVVCVRRPGGTWLLSDMLQYYCNELEAIPGVDSLQCDTASPLPEASSFLNQAQSGVPEYVYVLRQFQRKPGGAGDRVLRVAERLGWMKPLLVPSRSSKDPQPSPPPEPLASLYDVKAPLFASRPAVAVVNDHGSRRAFRNRMEEPEYYDAVRSLLDQGYEDADGSTKPVNLVWLAYAPVFESPLFRLLKDSPDLAQRTLVIVNADCLSDAGVDVRFDMSFEQALQALLSTPRVPDKFHSLIRCSQLLIRFEFGVLKVTADLSQNPRPDSYSIKDATVYFSDDDSTQWSRGRHGTMDGNTFLLSTCVVRSMLASIAQPQTDPFTRLPKAITWSLILSALHQERGYGSAKALHSPDNYVPPYISLLSEAEKNRDRTSEEAEGDPEALHFVTSPSCPVRIGKLSVPEPVLEMLALCTKDDDQAERSTLSTWSRVPHFNTNHHPYNGDPATAVATLGIEAMAYFEQGAGQRREPSLAWPYAEFGNIVAVVREEIDGLIACKEQLISYLYSKRLDEKPLALGVFGPPGSGKNFTVRQLLKSIDKRLSTESTVYNLSQFGSKAQLLDAFREIQDKGLANQTKGHDATIPVAIFDEFDCKVDAQPMGWLSEFLEPIQDGTFRAGQLSYRVGRSIMIFAGGTCERYKDFRAQAHSEELRDAKTKDFDSRLKGHLDVQGISPLPPKETDPEAHEVARFRRALTFRSLLRATHPDVIDPLTGRARVDEKVIAAFLDVSVYHHGVRSMESILKMSKQSTNRQSLHKASLPVFSQLDMHVVADEFMRIVHG